MYDSVWVKCPKCETENEFQSKSGDCSLEHYTLENCPEDVLANVNRHAPINCECGAAYSVDRYLRKPILVNVPNENKGTIIKNIKLIESDSKFLEKVSHKITSNGEEWFHMPFWYKKISENTYEEVFFENLPTHVTNLIRKNREE